MPSELEAYLHQHIPISRHMGMQVVEAGPEGVALSAPLEPNVNHRSTVFGGSTASTAILAAWTLVHLRVRAAGIEGRVVIHRGAMDYLAPIADKFTASCASPSEEAWDRFFRTLRRGRQARIELRADVRSAGVLVATYTGAYVAIPTTGPAEAPGT